MSASHASLPLRVAAMEVYTRHMYRAFAQSAVDIQLFTVPSSASASADAGACSDESKIATMNSEN